jgi:hypothetical protein
MVFVHGIGNSLINIISIDGRETRRPALQAGSIRLIGACARGKEKAARGTSSSMDPQLN